MAKFVSETEMKTLRGMLKELLEVEEGLLDSEIDFIESLNNWDGTFTVGQAEYLEKIYKRRM